MSHIDVMLGYGPNTSGPNGPNPNPDDDSDDDFMIPANLKVYRHYAPGFE